MEEVTKLPLEPAHSCKSESSSQTKTVKIVKMIKFITRNMCLAEPHKSVNGKGQEWGKITKKTNQRTLTWIQMPDLPHSRLVAYPLDHKNPMSKLGLMVTLFTAFGPGNFGAKRHLNIVKQFSMIDFRKISKVLRETSAM